MASCCYGHLVLVLVHLPEAGVLSHALGPQVLLQLFVSLWFLLQGKSLGLVGVLEGGGGSGLLS